MHKISYFGAYREEFLIFYKCIKSVFSVSVNNFCKALITYTVKQYLNADIFKIKLYHDILTLTALKNVRVQLLT